ncbi:MAG: hypothetical protein AAGF07_02120 [Patescibacteria group bacterium]
MTNTNKILITILIIVISGAIGFVGGKAYQDNMNKDDDSSIEANRNDNENNADELANQEEDLDIEEIKDKLPSDYKIYTEEELNEIVQEAIADRELNLDTAEEGTDYITPN